jgi:hypothetical protein
MKVKFVQFYCAKHKVLLSGVPLFEWNDEEAVHEPDMSDMLCPAGQECSDHYVYDIEVTTGGSKITMQAVEL